MESADAGITNKQRKVAFAPEVESPAPRVASKRSGSDADKPAKKQRGSDTNSAELTPESSRRLGDVIALDSDLLALATRTGRTQHASLGDGWCWFESAAVQMGGPVSKQDVRTQMADAMGDAMFTPTLQSWMGNFGPNVVG